MIKAIVFDLDDTLYPETDYVKSGFKAIGEHFDDFDLPNKLWALFEENPSDVYQRAGLSQEECSLCIRIYREHIPQLKLAADVKNTLDSLIKKGYKLGIITDGTPERQRNKIAALGLEKMMNCIIVTDELGGLEFRKPNPASFEKMRESLGVEFDEMMYVGDNPQKDFCIAEKYPIVTVRLYNNGIYCDNTYKNNVKEMYSVENLTQIEDILKN